MSYSDALSSPLDEVRHLIGDTDIDEPLFSDAEIMYEIGKASDSVTVAARACCRAMMARYARMADTSELDLSVKASQLYDHAKDLLNTLQHSSGGSLDVLPYAGGISNADIFARVSNSDRHVGVFEGSRILRPTDRYGVR